VRNFLNIRVLIGAGLVGVCMFAVLLAFLSASRQDQLNISAGTPILNVIPAPTTTPPSPLASPTLSLTPTQVVPPPPISGTITIGAYVQITGTGGDGLRLRVDPGLDGTVRFMAIDSEVFQVLDGPLEIDGYIWWFLQAPYDVIVQGWAVSNYLILVQNP
jgi:hypothetical protein